MPCLVDSGSTIDVISTSLAKRLSLPLVFHTIPVNGIGGGAHSAGRITLPVTIGCLTHCVEFHAFDFVPYDILIGTPTAALFNLKLDFSTLTVYQKPTDSLEPLLVSLSAVEINPLDLPDQHNMVPFALHQGSPDQVMCVTFGDAALFPSQLLSQSFPLVASCNTTFSDFGGQRNHCRPPSLQRKIVSSSSTQAADRFSLESEHVSSSGSYLRTRLSSLRLIATLLIFSFSLLASPFTFPHRSIRISIDYSSSRHFRPLLSTMSLSKEQLLS